MRQSGIIDHSRDPCPWVVLSDFGGAFAMGVGSPHHSLQHIRANKKKKPLGRRRRNLARGKRLQEFSQWRTLHRSAHIDKSPSTRPRW